MRWRGVCGGFFRIFFCRVVHGGRRWYLRGLVFASSLGYDAMIELILVWFPDTIRYDTIQQCGDLTSIGYRSGRNMIQWIGLIRLLLVSSVSDDFFSINFIQK